MNEKLNPVVKADSLSISFAGNTVLQEVSFTINKGEVFALLGGNGAGKSTTLKTLLGLVPPSGGAVSILGQEVAENVEVVRRQVAYVPESVMLYSHLTGIENIQYFLSLAQVQKTRAEIENALERVSLQRDAWSLLLGKYSKGMRQKTALALAILRDAPVLLLDEPTSGLDPAAIDEFNRLITSLAEGGATVFMVSHDIYGACKIAHRIGLLDQGRIVGTFDRNYNEQIDIETVHTAFSQRGQR